MMTDNVETYFIDGCGRCDKFGTPACKVNTWRNELTQLRQLLLACGLTEEAKWGMPCYTYKSKNVILLSAFVDYCSLNFFKGALMQDPEHLLEKPGENSQAARLMKFTQVEQITAKPETIKAYIYEAIEIEKAGLKVNFKKNPEPLPEELIERFTQDPELESAFNALTPGRQRGYILHFSQAKQTQTRIARIEKCKEKIMSGKGFQDR